MLKKIFFIKKRFLFGPQLTKHHIIQITGMTVFDMLFYHFNKSTCLNYVVDKSCFQCVA